MSKLLNRAILQMPAKLTLAIFIERAERVFGEGRHDYSKFIYRDTQTKGIIRCIQHSIEFEQTPCNHLKGYSGCRKCPGVKGVKRKIDTDELIEKSKEIFGEDAYRYEDIGEPQNTKSLITLHCNGCNKDFVTTFDAHVYHKKACPCKGKQPLDGGRRAAEKVSETNNVAVLHPEIAREWRTAGIKPEDVSPVSHRIVDWCCDNGHEWSMEVYDRVKKGKNCPECGEKPKDKSLATNAEAVKWWSPNNEKTPADYSYGSGATVLFICDCPNQHEFKMRICNFHNGERCPYKAGKLIDDANSAMIQIPGFIDCWDYDKNDESPEKVSYGSGKKYWFICDEGHNWQTTPNGCNTGVSCPECRPHGRSPIASRWITETMDRDNIHIIFAGNGGEYTIPGTAYRADGYCAETNTIYEFYGDFWHGNPEVFDLDKMNNVKKMTHRESYNMTARREQKILDLGYNLVSIWENDYRKQIAIGRAKK